MHYPSLGEVIVTAEEILPAAGAHVGGRNRDIGVEGKVVGSAVRTGPGNGFLTTWRDETDRDFGRWSSVQSTSTIIHAIITTRSQRVRGHGPARMIGDTGDVGREEALVGLVDSGGDIGPPQECLNKSGSIADPHFEFQA